MTDNQFGFIDRRGGVPMLARQAAALTPEFLYEPEAPDQFDLKKIWSAIRRNFLLIASIVAAALALGVISLFVISPTYRATASVEIANQSMKVLGTEEFQQINGSQESDRLLQTQIDILKSRALAERVSDGLNLAASDRFLLAQAVTPKGDIRGEQIIEALQDNLLVSLPRNSRVVPIRFESTDPKIAAMIANAYAENLIAGNLQRHLDTSSYSKEFLQNQLTLTKARLERSERALLSYARSAGLVDPSAGAGDPNSPTNNAPRSLTSANLIDLNQSLAQAKSARIHAEGRWREAHATPVMSLPDVLSNPAIQQMTQKRAELESQYQQEMQRRKAEHPAVQQAAAAIRELDSQISGLANSIRNSIRNQYLTARQQESQLASAVGQLKDATLAEQTLGIRYNILKREVDTNRQLYDGLLQRFKQVSAEAGVSPNNIAIVDRAHAPMVPVSPDPFLNIMIALLAGLIVAAGVVATREVFHDGVRSPDEVESRFGTPLLGVVPRLSASRATDALADPRSQLSEAYQTVRASVELSCEGGAPKTLLVTSCREGEGKTTTALAMARDAAAAGRKVILVDADMRRPSLHSLLNIPKVPGLADLLTQQLPADVVIHQTETPGLFVLPAGPKPPSPAELLSGAGFRALLSYLKEHYDQIIIDSPPVLGLADAPRLSAAVDGTVIVIEAARSQRGAIEAAMRRLRASRGRIIGAVLVKFDASKADVGSNYLLEYYSYGESDSLDDQSGRAAAA